MERDEVLVLQKASRIELHLRYKNRDVCVHNLRAYINLEIREIKIKSVKFFQFGDARWLIANPTKQASRC